ncbi:AfsR/SARP family transcriptional regulator [Dactylosporangium sp. CA-092794]|uniref:AfsR/SARP family transcriptional regulator n=1 Tax=Dactylosporangium sp. CA-092794 TaxID=3239929 RepID=UPI003D8F4772
MSARPAPPHPVTVRLLGPIEVAIGDRPLELGHARQRSVLAVLAVEANRVVSRAQLADRVWGDRAPASVTNLLYGYLGRLRALLEPTGGAVSIQRRTGGYRLAVEEDAVDLLRFRRLAARARAAGGGADAAGLWEQALAVWSGEPFSGAADGWLAGVRRRLADERRAAILDANEHLLDRGGHDALLGPLRELAAEHPYDERVAAQLATALHHCGRSAEALAVLARIRRRLATEFGLGAGPALRELERRILRERSPAAPAYSAAATAGAGARTTSAV